MGIKCINSQKSQVCERDTEGQDQTGDESSPRPGLINRLPPTAFLPKYL